MKFSKKQIIKSAFEDPNVKKTGDALIYTVPFSEVREIASLCFEVEFCKVSSKIFSRFFKNFENNGKFKIDAVITSKCKEKLQNINPLRGELERLLVKEDMFVFEINYLDQTLITLKYFDTEENGNSSIIVSDIYFSKDKEKNDIIYEVLKVLEEISTN